MSHYACGCGNYAIWTHLGPPSNTWRCPKCGQVVTERHDPDSGPTPAEQEVLDLFTREVA